MNIEKQVCTLQQARILKELGAPQDSVFTWLRPLCKDDFIVEYGNAEQLEQNDKAEGNLIRRQLPTVKDREFYAAYTVAELGAMLPNHLPYANENGLIFSSHHPWVESDLYTCGYLELSGDYETGAWIVSKSGVNEAIARASLLIDLIKTNRITPEEINTRLQNA